MTNCTVAQTQHTKGRKTLKKNIMMIMDARNKKKKKKITAAQAIQLLELHKKKQNDLHRRNTAVYKPANASVSMVGPR